MHLNRYLWAPLVVLAVVFAATMAVHAQDRKAPFVDEGEQQTSFASYRKALLKAIVARDVDTIVASASPDIHLDFGGGEGRDEFRKRLTAKAEDFGQEYAYLADQHREEYWGALEEVLRLGGVFTKPDTFEAPYTWIFKLKDSDDVFATSFVIGSDVPMRARASKYGDVTTLLDDDIVKVLDGGKGTSFVEIQLADGRKGYVHKDHLRSAIDYRAIFENSGGRWLMIVFIAGD